MANTSLSGVSQSVCPQTFQIENVALNDYDSYRTWGGWRWGWWQWVRGRRRFRAEGCISKRSQRSNFSCNSALTRSSNMPLLAFRLQFSLLDVFSQVLSVLHNNLER